MAVIGLAMLGFILGDFKIGQGGSKIAEINGDVYDVKDYQDQQEVILNFYKMTYGQNLDPQTEKQIADEAWRNMIRESVMGATYKKVGLEVSTDELKAMVAGVQTSGLGSSSAGPFSQPHPFVRQMFTNPETGEYNYNYLRTYMNSLDREEYASERERWSFIENEIVEQQLNQKYLNLISKGLRSSSLDASDYMEENAKRVDFSYVAKNFAAVSDDEITITDKDLSTYYNEHIEEFKSDESRSIEYVVFEVVASEADDANAKLWTTQTKNEFNRISDDEIASYVNSVSDHPFDGGYYSTEEVDQLLQDSLLTAETGTIFGPYYEDEAYHLSKISDEQMRPDSVRARHILLAYQVIGDINRTKEMADSLKTVIENGGDFASIARDYSADQNNSAIGGDLGWFREGETPYDDVCFESKVGDILTETVNYGVYIIKVENQSRPVKKYQIATVTHGVYPSNETDQEFYNRAVKFRGKATNLAKFEEQAREYGLDPRVVPDISKDQRTIPGLSSPEQIIGWAYNAKAGDVSTIYDVDDKYIVAAVTEVIDDGYASLEDVKSEVQLAVTKQKKAEIIMESMKQDLQSAGTLEGLAEAQELEVKEANQVMFANTYVSEIGIEPFIVGTAMSLPLDQVAGPYIGENSVFVLTVVNRQEGTGNTNLEVTRSRLNTNLQSRCTYEAYNAMIDAADIKDNRLEVYYGR